MESATLSALAALGGATVGGVTSLATTWLSQQAQARIQQIAHKLSQREELYKGFIGEASKLYADALINELSDVSKLVGLYAMISRMRVLSSRTTVEAADQIARTLIETYQSPNKSLMDLQGMVTRGEIDILRTFSEAARQEFHGLGM